MRAELRAQILAILDQHATRSPAAYLGDDELANFTGESIATIRLQLEVLRSEHYVNLTTPLTGNWGAQIRPKGKLYVERLREELPPRRPIGLDRDA